MPTFGVFASRRRVFVCCRARCWFSSHFFFFLWNLTRQKKHQKKGPADRSVFRYSASAFKTALPAGKKRPYFSPALWLKKNGVSLFPELSAIHLFSGAGWKGKRVDTMVSYLNIFSFGYGMKIRTSSGPKHIISLMERAVSCRRLSSNEPTWLDSSRIDSYRTVLKWIVSATANIPTIGLDTW